MEKGFLPALGTPLDERGYVVANSLQAEVERQIQAGCCGMLVMGSMGQQAFIRSGETPKIARLAIEQAKGRVPVFVGAMDCSINRAAERMESMEDLKPDAFVFTTPYYKACTRDQVISYFQAVGKATKRPIMLYDLPVATQTKITYDMVTELSRTVPNLIGIKSADLKMLRRLRLEGEVPADFITCYSDIDLFDVGFKWGIPNYLDGMISCTPRTFEKLDKAMKAGDFEAASPYLSSVIWLRDFFAKRSLWPCFTAAMNMLGYEGNFAPDYVPGISDATVEEVREAMKKLGEL